MTSAKEEARRVKLGLRNTVRAAVRRLRIKDYKATIAATARNIIGEEYGGGAPKHGWRPPGVVVRDDDALPGGAVDFKHYRTINMRTGLVATDDGDRVDIDARVGGVFCVDYLVNSCWAAEVAAGRGTEGEEIDSGFGCTFRVYSEPIAAAVHAKDNRTTSEQGTTFLVCGEHTITAPIEAQTGGTLQVDRWLGVNPGSSRFVSGADNLDMFVCNGEGTGSGADPTFYIENIGFDTAAKGNNRCIVGESQAEIHVDKCRLDLTSQADSEGIVVSNDSRGTYIIETYIVGTAGIGIRLETEAFVYVYQCHIDGLDVGIKATASVHYMIADNEFYQNDIAIFIGGNAFQANCAILDNQITLPGSGKGIQFASGTNINGWMGISDNVITNITGTNVGIDTLTATTAIILGLAIHDNVFESTGTPAGAKGISGPTNATNVVNSIISGNTFVDFLAGTEMPEWDTGNGNEAYHNMSTSDDGTPTKNALADIGSPVGHVTGGDSHDHDGGDGATVSHDVLSDVSVDDHHSEDHDHDGSPTQQLLAANTHESASSATHHVTSRPYTYSITFGWDPQSPQVFAP